ncbi:MAG: protein-glutamate O-methyltransferase CheR [Deltaproteobacteria bacterium]|nr:protein-glutamate O-methyltransferase CheR [Deltaproteobacteria bacterium]
MSEAAAHLPCPQAPPLSDEDFGVLHDFVYDRSGLCFGAGKRFFFESRVHRRLHARGLDSAWEYRAVLRSPDQGPAELLELLDVLTTHETSFFRGEAQIAAFRRTVVPEVLGRRRRGDLPCLQIWSAACSSGEEPYTLAMVLLEALGSEARRWKIRIVGSDVAKSVLERAHQAVYSQYSLRNTPPYFVQKYFDVAGRDAFQVKPAVRSLVEFRLVNFADDARMRAMGEFQIVFCRNALIYFDEAAKARFVSHFVHALEPGGYLFLGHSESLHHVCDDLHLVSFPGAMAYRRPEEGAHRREPWTSTR